MNIKEEFKNFIPGFTMGITRAIVSHPFEIMKLKSQMNITSNFYRNLFRGVHLSIISNSLERGIQFYWFDKFKKKYNNNLQSSFLASLISTSISLPYNVILLRNTLLKNNNKISKNILIKSGCLEYIRNISGSTIFMFSYNYFKDNNKPIYVSSILSSVIVWSLTYPIDNIKNNIIAEKKINYTIYNLYNGVQYPMIRSIPSSVIGFYVYEYLNKYLNNK